MSAGVGSQRAVLWAGGRKAAAHWARERTAASPAEMRGMGLNSHPAARSALEPPLQRGQERKEGGRRMMRL